MKSNRFKRIVSFTLLTVLIVAQNFLGNMDYAKENETYIDILAIQNASIAVGESGKVYITGITTPFNEVRNWTGLDAIDYQDGHIIGYKNGTEVKRALIYNNTYPVKGDYQEIKALLSYNGTTLSYNTNYEGFRFYNSIPESQYNELGLCVTDFRCFFSILKNGKIAYTAPYGALYKAVNSWSDMMDICMVTSTNEYGIGLVGLKRDGTVLYAGIDQTIENTVSTWKDVAKISAGAGHVLALKKDGTLLAAGNNKLEQLNVTTWAKPRYLPKSYETDLWVRDGWNGYYEFTEGSIRGLMDDNGKIVLSGNYRSIYPLYPNYFYVEDQNGKRVINQNGKTLYKEALNIHAFNGKYYISEDYGNTANMKIVTSTGKIMYKSKYRLLGYHATNPEVFYAPSFEKASHPITKNYVVLKKINASGKVSAELKTLTGFSVSVLAPVFKYGLEPVSLYLGKDNETKYTYITENLVPLSKTNIYDAADPFTGEIARVKINDRYGFINTTGKFVVQPIYLIASSFKEDRALVMDPANSLYGFIDKAGKYAVQPKYVDALPFINGVAFVKDLESPYYKLIDKNGNIILETIYTNITYPFFNAGMYRQGDIHMFK